MSDVGREIISSYGVANMIRNSATSARLGGETPASATYEQLVESHGRGDRGKSKQHDVKGFIMHMGFSSTDDCPLFVFISIVL